MRYWFDTEFIEDGRTIDLVSIGIVAEDGRELYLLNRYAPFWRASDWVRDNVLVHLPPLICSGEDVRPEAIKLPPDTCHENIPDMIQPDGWVSPNDIRDEVCAFLISLGDKPEIWAYYGSYDWVVLCQLFGRMIDLPRWMPMYVRDVKQLADSMSNPRLPPKPKDAHNALADARWTKEAWECL